MSIIEPPNLVINLIKEGLVSKGGTSNNPQVLIKLRAARHSFNNYDGHRLL